MKKQTLLLSILALATFASCEKTPTIKKEGRFAEMTIDFGQSDSKTRSLGLAEMDSYVAMHNIVEIKLFSKEFKDVDVINDAPIKTDYVEFVRSKGKYRAQNIHIPDGAITITAVANRDGLENTYTRHLMDATVNSRQGNVANPVVRLLPEQLESNCSVSKGDNNTATCSISLVPEMARIEILDDMYGKSFPHVKNLIINAIYLNNVKETRDVPGVTQRLKDVSSDRFINEYSSNGDWSNLVTRGPVHPNPQVWRVTDSDGKAYDSAYGGELGNNSVGYNFYPQPGAGDDKEDAKKRHPHIIFHIAYTKDFGTSIPIESAYLTVTALRDEADVYISEYMAGSVYTIKLSDILALISKEGTPIGPTPDPESVHVEISVTVADWVPVSITDQI